MTSHPIFKFILLLAFGALFAIGFVTHMYWYFMPLETSEPAMHLLTAFIAYIGCQATFICANLYFMRCVSKTRN